MRSSTRRWGPVRGRGSRRRFQCPRLPLGAGVLVALTFLPSALAAQQSWFAGRDTLTAVPDTVQRMGGNCVRCHVDLEEERLALPAHDFTRSVHARAGFDCVACHGGDASASTRGAAHAGSVTKPSRRRIPELCSRCHSRANYMKRFAPNLRVDQMDRYLTSVHGRRLFELGDTLVAVCVDCHSSHLILPPDDEKSTVYPATIPETCGQCHADSRHMARYDIPTDQEEEYERSVHWAQLTEEGDLSSPVCNDCHGNHGAAPPEVESVHNVCGQCHFQMDQLFTASVHDSVFAARELPGCVTCHGNHEITSATDRMLALEEPGVCGNGGCHSPADSGGVAAVAMGAAIDSLQRSRERADSILDVAEQAGMEVSQAQFELSGVQNPLVNARIAVHSASPDSVEAAVSAGLEITEGAYDRGESALRELEVRRLGLAVSSAVIVILIGGLLLKIRGLEKPEGGTA